MISYVMSVFLSYSFHKFASPLYSYLQDSELMHATSPSVLHRTQT